MKTFNDIKVGDYIFVTDIDEKESIKQGQVIVHTIKCEVVRVTNGYDQLNIVYRKPHTKFDKPLILSRKDSDKEYIERARTHRLYFVNEERINEVIRFRIENTVETFTKRIKGYQKQIDKITKIGEIYNNWLKTEQA